MNKKGHVALGVAIGSGVLLTPFFKELLPGNQLAASLVFLASAAAASLAPDLDHKTSTVSNWFQLSTAHRRLSRTVGSILLLIGVLLLLGPKLGIPLVTPAGQSAFVWIGAGILGLVLSNLRSLVFLIAGVLLLAGYSQFHWHWFTAFAGVSLMILPAVKHRGIIHTPEFAFALSAGVYTFVLPQAWYVQAIGLGFITGWWAHLAGDLFGKEGLHSLFVPKVKIALRLFDNGGAAERRISTLCWFCSLLIWVYMGFTQVVGGILPGSSTVLVAVMASGLNAIL